MVLVLGTEDHDGPGVGESFEFGAHGLDDGGGEDVGGVGGELCDVFADFVEEEGGVDVLVGFGDSFDRDDVGVQDGELLFEFEGDGNIGLLDVLVGLEEDVVGAFVVAVFLFLGGDGDCYFGCVSEVFEDAVEAVGVDGVFGLSVCLAHEVVQQFLDEVFLGGVAFYELQHVVDEDLPCLDVQFQSFELVVGQVVLTGGFVPHALALVVQCDLGALLGCALF